MEVWMKFVPLISCPQACRNCHDHQTCIHFSSKLQLHKEIPKVYMAKSCDLETLSQRTGIDVDDLKERKEEFDQHFPNQLVRYDMHDMMLEIHNNSLHCTCIFLS